jgi:hypothetical protein
VEPYYVHDDVLTRDQHIVMERFAFDVISDQADMLYTLEACECFTPLIDIASKHFDLTSALYYELWQQYNPDVVPPHIDKDEKLNNRGVLKTPLCSLVFYHHISDDIEGGELVIKDSNGLKHEIQPKTNRLVIFEPNLVHWVKDYEGHRHSILCNPWDRPLGVIDYV